VGIGFKPSSGFNAIPTTSTLKEDSQKQNYEPVTITFNFL